MSVRSYNQPFRGAWRYGLLQTGPEPSREFVAGLTPTLIRRAKDLDPPGPKT
jgi:hypothetical protein